MFTMKSNLLSFLYVTQINTKSYMLLLPKKRSENWPNILHQLKKKKKCGPISLSLF